MSITILPQQQLKKQSTSDIIRKVPLIHYPSPSNIYTHRNQRLKQLTKDSPFADYLQFCAHVVEKQNDILSSDPVCVDFSNRLNSTLPPLSLDNYPLTHKWQDYLLELISQLPKPTPQISEVITALEHDTKSQRQEKALLLLKGKFNQVDSNQSLFIWSALSLYYTQLASQINGQPFCENSDKHWLCPICNSLPVASSIHIGSNVGLRYLHCSLCETEWYVPRVKCTSCDDLEHVHYFSLDEELTAAQTECCDSCHGYLKIFNQEHAANLDIMADDIATLILDMKTEEEGFAKSGLNPFLFSHNDN